MSEQSQRSPEPPTPLAYQREIVGYLKENEPDLWKWASSSKVRGEYAEEMRTVLLKENYRLDAEGHPELTERCRSVRQRLGMDIPVTLYQATGRPDMNAMLCHLPGEAHIIFTGTILETLKGAELDAVLAHELAHYQLWELEDGDFLVADRLLMAAANDARGSSVHAQTARRFRLYTEIYADRGSLCGCGQLEVAVTALVKTGTGLQDVSASGYLKQAEEIFSRENATAKGLDHPETFIRARALRMWSEKDSALEEWLAATIEGPLSIESLDLVGQRRTGLLTRRFLSEFLRPSWFQSPATLAHARAFFPDFVPSAKVDDELFKLLKCDEPATCEYWSYLMLDFANVDRDLENLPLARAMEWSSRLGISEKFEGLVAKELGFGKRQMSKLKKEGKSLLEGAESRP